MNVVFTIYKFKQFSSNISVKAPGGSISDFLESDRTPSDFSEFGTQAWLMAILKRRFNQF